MTELQSQAQALANGQAPASWLDSIREQGLSRFVGVPWPSRRTELWKYTSVANIGKKQLSRPADERTSATLAELLPQSVSIEMDATRLVFINGQFAPQVSDELPPGVTTFAGADAKAQEQIQQQLGRLLDSEKHLFAALNESTLEQGLLIYVERGLRLSKPICLINYSEGDHALLASTRVVIVLDDEAQAEIVEQFHSEDDAQANLVAAYTEATVGAGASLTHYRLNLEEGGVTHMGGVAVELGRDARFNGFAMARGAELIRNDYDIFHRGPGAHADLNGVYLPREKQVVDYHTNVQHCVPHCTTSEVFRGIIGDSAKAVFNGRIHIHQDAQKTLAELSNKNLLTSNKAEVDTKPELEIYADDVRCAHGATVAQLDSDSLYYLQTRGIDREQAQVMISFGFINELIQAIDNQAIADYLVPIMARQFSGMKELLEMEAQAFDAI